MGKNIYCVLVKHDHDKFAGNEYVRGRIAGFMEIICGPFMSVWTNIPDIGYTINVKCTRRKYNKLCEIIEQNYPDLCEFDY